MLVDGFTTVAQIVNFLILVWLLKRFLYKPVVRAMDERENRMAKALDDAEKQRADAENERVAFEKKSQELADQKALILRSAAEHAEEERKRMIAAAREEVTGLQARWREAITHEQAMLLDELTGRIQNEIFAISGQVLGDLAGVDLESCIAERFVERLKSFEPGESDRLDGLPVTSSGPVIITSAFSLPENSRRQVEEAVKQKFRAPEIRFVRAPELIGGIELCTNGHKISWNVQSYLASLKRDLGRARYAEGSKDGQPDS